MEPGTRLPRRSIERGLLALSLFLSLFPLYYLSPVVVINDSRYTMLVSEHFLLTGNLAVEEHFWPRVDSSTYPRVRKGRHLPRHVQPHGGHLYYLYPAGTPILSAPFAFLMRVLLGESTIDSRGRYRLEIDVIWQKRIAALLTAFSCVVFFWTASLLLSGEASLVIGLSAGLSSQLWSTASRTLQAHCWLVLLLSLSLYLIVRWLSRGGSTKPLLLGSLLAWSFFTRPTAAPLIFVLTIFVFARSRREGTRVMAIGLLWLAGLVVMSYSVFGSPLPPYYAKGASLTLAVLPTGLAGQLISPSRGLFVFVPLTLFVLGLAVRNWKALPHRDLSLALLAGIVLHTLSMSMFPNWWGGSSYGPRFSTDLIPLFVVLGIESYAAATANARRPALGRLGTTLFAVCFVLGTLFNGAGALAIQGKRWNSRPQSLAEAPSRAFDWPQAQFLCALFESRCPPATPAKPDVEGDED